MGFKRFILGCAILLMACDYAAAFDMQLPVRRIGNSEYFVYEVQKKESIYSISNKLGVSKTDIVKYNTKAEAGVRAGDTLFFPVDKSEASAEQTDSTTRKHVVKKDESLYGIAKTYNTTQEKIIEANPTVKQGVNSGDELIIPTEESVKPTEPVAKDTLVHYIIKHDDTLYKIIKTNNTTPESIFLLNVGMAPEDFTEGKLIRIRKNIVSPSEQLGDDLEYVSFEAYLTRRGDTYTSISEDKGVSVVELRQANPDVHFIKPKTTIYIPVSSAKNINGTDADRQALVEIYDSIQTALRERDINISLMLPFMLSQKEVTKQASLYTEFYKGFLLAVDEMKSITPSHININVIDTEDSNDKVNNVIKSGALSTANYIIAPENTSRLKAVAEYGAKHDIAVINPFVVKSDLAEHNKSFYQVNMPMATMLDRVEKYMINTFDDHEVIFLTIESLPEKDVIAQLRNALVAERGTDKVHEVTMDAFMVEEFDANLTDGKSYLIIPTNSSKSMIASINQGLRHIKSQRYDVDLTLFGFPEWIAYENDYKEFFKELNTYIYSRFYARTESPEYKEFVENYKSTYGTDLINAVPVFGALGYDLGKSILLQATSDEPQRYKGIQTDIDYKRINDNKGWVNDAMYIVNYSRSGVSRIAR